MALLSSTPLPRPCAAAHSLICATWIENTLETIKSKLGFAWPQSPCCSLCCRLFLLISPFKDQRKNFPEKRGQGEELEGIGNISFFFDLWSELSLVSCMFVFLSSAKAAESCVGIDQALLFRSQTLPFVEGFFAMLLT